MNSNNRVENVFQLNQPNLNSPLPISLIKKKSFFFFYLFYILTKIPVDRHCLSHLIIFLSQMLTPPKLTNGNIPCVVFPVPPYKLLSSFKFLQHITFRMLIRFLFFRIRSNCSRSQLPELPRHFAPLQSQIRFSVSRNPSVRFCLSNAKISVSVPQ